MPLLLLRPGPEPMAAAHNRCGRGPGCPVQLCVDSVGRVGSPGAQQSAHSDCRLQGRLASMSIDLYQHPSTCPKVLRLTLRS